MKTRESTTLILLDKGTEDLQLLRQLESIIGPNGHGVRANYKLYPMVMDLMYILRDETGDR